MLSPAPISKQLEFVRRFEDPYYLTSKVIAAGSLLSEGEHFYINKNASLWKEAVQLIFEKIYTLQEKYKANSIILRDFQHPDSGFEHFMVDNGFYKVSMPDTHIVENLDTWHNKEEFYQNLSKRSRQHFREDVRKHESKYDVEVITSQPSDNDIDTWYELYLNVKRKNLDLNTFDLPKKFFSQLFVNKNWEVLKLSLKPGLVDETGESKLVCIVINYKSPEAYMPMVIGIDYTYNTEFKIYRQALYQLIMRGKSLGAKKVFLGFAAGIEKKKFGAKANAVYAFAQIKDSYNAQVLAGLTATSSNVEASTR
jgi:hypothetical protein